MINKIKDNYLKKILLILVNFLLILIIIKECKLIGFCYTILNLISPLFIGYVIAWLLKPIMLKINKHLSIQLSAALTYTILAIIIAILGYFFIPVVVNEVKNLIPNVIDFYNNLPSNIKNNIDLNAIGTKAITMISNSTTNAKNIILNIFYSVFISYFYLVRHKEVTKLLSKYIPGSLANDISLNLKAFVRGTLIDTLVLFLMTLISFYFIKMPYSLLFAIIISITNIIPYIGPYIGGIPAVLVALSISPKFGIIILGLVIVLQFIESTFLHPIIMSKSLNISPLFIIIGIIVFGYFFGIIGMLISTPLVSIIKSCYEFYYLKRNKKNKVKPLK